ncbi:hypothetical protein HK101_000962 [Irineochytrium annulatum]|nr:hypothetical protein HK101_000962 [Irineochytrium annulatum]
MPALKDTTTTTGSSNTSSTPTWLSAVISVLVIGCVTWAIWRCCKRRRERRAREAKLKAAVGEPLATAAFTAPMPYIAYTGRAVEQQRLQQQQQQQLEQQEALPELTYPPAQKFASGSPLFDPLANERAGQEKDLASPLFEPVTKDPTQQQQQHDAPPSLDRPSPAASAAMDQRKPLPVVPNGSILMHGYNHVGAVEPQPPSSMASVPPMYTSVMSPQGFAGGSRATVGAEAGSTMLPPYGSSMQAER